MRLTFVVTSLELGGAQRTVSVLANSWARLGREVTVIIFDQDDTPSYRLDPHVALRSLGVTNGRASNFLQAISRNSRRLWRLRREIRNSRPDVVISFMDYTNIMTLLSSWRLHLPVIVSEQANPDHEPMGRLWETLRRLMYPHASMLVCPTTRMTALLGNRFRVRGRSIPNLVEMPSPAAKVSQDKQNYVAVAMGRLVPQKGFDLLLDAFSQIAEKHPEWSLVIIGKGPLREQLATQAKLLGLDSRVRFTGEITDPFPVLKAGDLFVFSSRFEGFGNALVEAMGCGLPAISFDCVAGPSDIIRDGVDGILVAPEDVSALAAAMERLMGDAREREKLASRALEVSTRFSLEKILGLWDELFDVVVPGCAELSKKQEATPLV